jgi:hypothetical protein
MIDLNDFDSLAAAEAHSVETLSRVKARVEMIPTLVEGLADVIAVGSYGRGEAVPQVSDFEWITIYDDRLVAREEAIVLQAELTRGFADVFGRSRLSISKTFGEVAELSALGTNVGGEADSNQTLTYRMLTIAEGRSLTAAAHDKVIDALARTYGRTHTAGHRLLSLATEIARYWRTLRIDYKFKVDENRKPWALRNMKLRSYRRFWYFASAIHFVAFGPRATAPARIEVGEGKKFLTDMGGNPAMRFLLASDKLEIDPERVGRMLRTYDAIHRRCALDRTRAVLEALPADEMENEPVFTELREFCRDLHHQMAEMVISLGESPRREMLEMFLL